MEGTVPYRTYWRIWGILLVLTLVMIGTEAVDLPRTAGLVLLIAAMLTKATLIGGWFMHLRFERASLVWPLVASTIITAAFLYFLLIPDALGVLAEPPG